MDSIMEWKKDRKKLIFVRTILIGIYSIIILGPAVLLTIMDPSAWSGTFLYEIGQLLGLIAYPVLALQSVLSARIRLLDRAFALNTLINFHRTMAVAGGAAVLLHPILLAAGTSNWALLFSFNQDWSVLVGKGALLILILIILTSLFIAFFRFTYEKWRFFHNMFFMLVLAGVFIHSFFAGTDLLLNTYMRVIWAVLLGVAIAAYLGHKAVRPLLLRRKPFVVKDVNQETKNVWTLRFEPVESDGIDYAPGQFQFIKLKRGRGLPAEEHHFTISSSPEEKPEHTATIKSVGDFTSTIKDTKSGDRAVIQAPFGRFSYLLHSWENNFVFIAGGIGITPIIGMLRHMRDTRKDRRVLLIFGNNQVDEIVFREELEEMENLEKPDLKVVHVLVNPPDGWEGEKGFVTENIIKKYTGETYRNRYYYVCGPPVMMDKVIGTLKKMGVAKKHIHSERFSL